MIQLIYVVVLLKPIKKKEKKKLIVFNEMPFSITEKDKQ